MEAQIAALFRHPLKGFTPERLERAELVRGGPFPGDRLYAVEDGPSGFDPAAPVWIRKQSFTVLAKIAEVARAKTQFDAEGRTLTATAPGRPSFAGDLTSEAGRTGFAEWLADLLGEAASGPLKVLDAPGHRFLDHPLGHVSIINLASVRDLEARLGRPVDPLRFRGNLLVDHWPAWAENDWVDRTVWLGPVRTKVFKPIVRCAAPGVDPATAVRDMDIPAELHRLYGHLHCGIYVHVEEGGTVREGDAARVE